MDLRETIDNLKKQYTDPIDKEQLKGWEQRVVEGLAIQSLEQKEGIILIKQKYNKEMARIDDMLLTEEKMTEVERAFLFERRNWMTDFLRIFERANLDNLSKEINEQL